jgi:hypothetical protein
MTMLANQNEKRPFVDPTKLGEHAAQQPLSGVGAVDEDGSVHGLAGGGYLRAIKPVMSERE